MNKSNFLKNSALTFGRDILVIVLGLLTSVLIARILGPEKQGVYTLIILLPTMLVTFLNLGVSSATVYFIGQKKYRLETIISSNVILSFIISFVSILVGLLIIYFFNDSFFDGVPIILLLIILGIVPALFYNSFVQAIFQGLENFKVYNAITLVAQFINLISLIITIYLLPLDLIGALVSYLFGQIMTFTLVTSVLKRLNYKVKFKYFSLDFVKESFNYGYKAHLSNIVSFLNYRSDILLISLLLTPLSVGIYNVAVQIAERLWILSKPISTVLFPRISSSNEKEQNDLTAVVSRNVLFLSLIFGIVFFILSDLFVWILFGSAYESAVLVIKILLPGITLFSAERILSNSLAGKGKPELNLYTSIFTVIINIILNIILIPIFGLSGAAIATSIAYILTYFVKTYIYMRLTKQSFLSIMIVKKSDFKIYKQILVSILKKVKK